MGDVPEVMQAAFWVTVTIVPWIVAIAFTHHVISEPKKALEKLRKEYEETIKAKNEQIRDLRERLEFLKTKHKEELKQYTKLSRMLKELNAALSEGAVVLKCPKHPDADVQILADGTIVCSKGHRLWPKGEEHEG